MTLLRKITAGLGGAESAHVSGKRKAGWLRNPNLVESCWGGSICARGGIGIQRGGGGVACPLPPSLPPHPSFVLRRSGGDPVAWAGGGLGAALGAQGCSSPQPLRSSCPPPPPQPLRVPVPTAERAVLAGRKNSRFGDGVTLQRFARALNCGPSLLPAIAGK